MVLEKLLLLMREIPRKKFDLKMKETERGVAS
jgi:hypothetical protein